MFNWLQIQLFVPAVAILKAKARTVDIDMNCCIAFYKLPPLAATEIANLWVRVLIPALIRTAFQAMSPWVKYGAMILAPTKLAAIAITILTPGDKASQCQLLYQVLHLYTFSLKAPVTFNFCLSQLTLLKIMTPSNSGGRYSSCNCFRSVFSNFYLV